MERMGPESSMLMAAAPIACRATRGERALWELPLDADRAEPTMLAASPALAGPTRAGGAHRLLAWLHVARDGPPAGEY
jgi:hypothetical protein